MADFPDTRLQSHLVLSTISPDSVGLTCFALGGTMIVAAWPTANLAIFVPIIVRFPVTIVKMFIENGATVSGNVDVGIYGVTGNRLVSSGSIAQAGVSAIQEFDIVDTVLVPGIYYLAEALDNTTGTLGRMSVSTLSHGRAMGMAQMATAFPLPATATFAATAQSFAPIIYATPRTVV